MGPRGYNNKIGLEVEGCLLDFFVEKKNNGGRRYIVRNLNMVIQITNSLTQNSRVQIN